MAGDFDELRPPAMYGSSDAWLCVTRWFTYEAQLKCEAEYAHGMKYLPIGAILKPTMAEARSNVQATK